MKALPYLRLVPLGLLLSLGGAGETSGQETGEDGSPEVVHGDNWIGVRGGLGWEWIGGPWGEHLDGHVRGEFTVFLYRGRSDRGLQVVGNGGADLRNGLRVGAGWGWVSYGLRAPTELYSTLNSSRGFLIVGFPLVRFTSRVNTYIEGRATWVHLREEKDVSGEGSVPLAEEPPPASVRGPGVGLALGFEIRLPWTGSGLHGLHLDVSARYGEFWTQDETDFQPFPDVVTPAHGHTGGIYVSLLWHP